MRRNGVVFDAVSLAELDEVQAVVGVLEEQALEFQGAEDAFAGPVLARSLHTVRACRNSECWW